MGPGHHPHPHPHPLWGLLFLLGMTTSAPPGTDALKLVADSTTRPRMLPQNCGAICFLSESLPPRAGVPPTQPAACIRNLDLTDPSAYSIVRPARDRRNDGAAVTHDMTFRNPALKARTPFVKPPFYVDYGLRVRIGGSTFINRGCMIMDTPVADVTIGERCNIGPNCCIISVGHPLSVEERSSAYSSIGKPVTIGDHVWIGANVTIL